MAESCIVCLGDLPQDDSDAPISDVASISSKSPLRVPEPDATKPNTAASLQLSEGEREFVAHLMPCGHFLHDECLKPWVERANSCPVCRQTFNMVEVSASLKGPVVSSYAVQDKQQVADIDPSMIVEEDLFDEHDGPCMICESLGDENELLLCDGCSNTCHVMCAGLDGIPAGAWFCYTCQEDPQILANNYQTTGTGTRRQPRRRNGERAWERVWRSVFDRLNFDLEFPFEEEEESLPNRQRAEAERREFQEWRRRFDVAARQGAATRFRNTATILREPERRRPAPESQEEIRAWNAFEKARAAEEGREEPARNRRKRKSPTASPREPPTEPERKLKRPRTRRPQTVAESADSAGESSRAASSRTVAPSAIRPNSALRLEANGGPTFLESLISEVEAHPPTGGPDVDQWADYYSDAVERSPSPQNSSPDASPAASNHATPRNMTPPPHSPIIRPISPPLASTITPVFPPAPEFSPFSPIADSVERARSRHRSKHTSPSHSPSHSPTRAPISYEMKSEIQKMVHAALKPHYNRKQVDKDTFTDINRDVSRKLYDRVWEAGGLVDQAARERWEKVAVDEVETAVQEAKTKQDKKEDDRAADEAAASAAATTGSTNEIPVRSSATVSA